MAVSVKEIIETYNPDAPLAEASTPPYSWYVDPRILELERSTVFARSWQVVGRADQVREPGQYITCELAREPILVIRGNDGVLRGFFNVCRHHAATVMPKPEGRTRNLSLSIPWLDVQFGRRSHCNTGVCWGSQLRPIDERTDSGSDRAMGRPSICKAFA